LRASAIALFGNTPEWLRSAVYRRPRLHTVARHLARLSYPNNAWTWQQIRNGPAKGSWINAEPRTHKFLVSGHYEPAVQNFLVGELGPGSVLWDVGAHIGYVSLLAARLGAEVVAFEPLAANAGRIEDVFRRNTVNARLLRVALSDCDGIVYLEPGEESSTGRIAEQGAPVVARRIDSLEGDVPRPSHVKIDVEGHEEEVLRGASRLLRDLRPTLVIELHPTVKNPDRVFDLVSDAYRTEFLDDRHVAATPKVRKPQTYPLNEIEGNDLGASVRRCGSDEVR
jgi:FkbM family methyltransferase